MMKKNLFVALLVTCFSGVLYASTAASTSASGAEKQAQQSAETTETKARKSASKPGKDKRDFFRKS